MPVAAGRLRTRVVIQTVTRPDDGGGGTAEVWVDGPTVWAHIEPLRGVERYAAQQTTSRVSHRVTIRHRSVTPQQRIRVGERIFDVRGVLGPDVRDHLILECEERYI